jgi:hypothetical protein
MTDATLLQPGSPRLWIGRILSGLVLAFLAMDGIGKLLRLSPVVESTVALGFKAEDVFLIGLLLSLGVVLYAIPRTAILGAIYLTGYLGGAFAAHLRLENPLFTHVLFAVYVGFFMWLGLILRRPKLSRLLTGA